MPPAGGGNTRARQLRRSRPRKMVPHGPGGQMLRPAPRAVYHAPRSPAARRQGVRVIQRASRRASRPAPSRPYRPTKAQIRQSRAQARGYRSQGRAIERVANRKNRQQAIAREQSRIRKSALAEERHYRSQGEAIDKLARRGTLPGQDSNRSRDLAKLMRGRPLSQGILAAGGYDAALKRMNVPKAQRRATGLAPAIWALEQVSRPAYGVAGAADAAVRGKGLKGAARGASRGLRLKDHKLFSDVLKHAGWKPKSGLGKFARSAAGFALDVGLDPTTYASFGLTSVGGKAALKAATRVGEKAAKAEAKRLAPQVAARKVSKDEAKVRVAAARRDAHHKTLALHERRGTTGGARGVTLKVAGGKHVRKAIRRTGLERKGRPVAPLTRATSLVPLTGKFLGRTQTAQDLRTLLRRGGSELHGGIRPDDLTPAQQRLVKSLRRETRAEAEAGSRRVNARANALVDRVSAQEGGDVFAALEANQLKRLKGQAKPLAPSRKRPITAARSAKTRHDPDRLVTVARETRDELRRANRVGRRSGVVAGQVGTKSRTRAEVELAAKATPTRTIQNAKRVEAQKAYGAARRKLLAAQKAGKPSAIKAARREAEAARMRMRNFTRQQRVATRRKTEEQAAKAGQKEIRGRRFGPEGEARGYAPRTNEADIPTGNALRRAVENLKKKDEAVPRAEQLGGNKPTAPGAQRREYRKSRAALEHGTADERRVAAELSPDVRETRSRYGTRLETASAAANLNTKLVQSGQKLPANLTHGQFHALKDQGKGVYRVRRGILEEVTDYPQAARASQRHAGKGPAPGKGKAATGQAKATGGGGQYAILDHAVVKHIRERTPKADYFATRVFDKAQGTWKGVALATPGYLFRNVMGDAFNAAVHENPFTLARSMVKGQKALNAIGRLEKANRIFEKHLPKAHKTIKLTPEQAAALGVTKREIPAIQAAQIAEKMGVIRQGRFVELMEEGNLRPKGSHWWQNTVKRVEDSVRMTTFMGSLQRGLDPREAAANATKIHFDYGDLTPIEKGVLRRAMPFYTFTSRNLPLQARGIAGHPGKYAAVQKAREEGRRGTGLPEGYEEGENPYEARQLGIPIRLGGKIYTVSSALPFTDLNDVAAFSQGKGKIPDQAIARIGEMLSPALKTGPELKYNLSLFFRDQIEKGSDPYTRAPGWAIALAKRSPDFAKATGMVKDYVPPDGGKTWGWSRKADYAFRQSAPGPIAPLIDLADLGVKGGNARNMTKAQRILAASGLRAIEYKPSTAEVNKLYAEQDRLLARRQKLNKRAHPTQRQRNGDPYRINADHPTPEYTRLSKRLSDIGKRLDAAKRGERPRGFVGGRPVAESRAKKQEKKKGGQLGLGGSSSARLPLGGGSSGGSSGGRLPLR